MKKIKDTIEDSLEELEHIVHWFNHQDRVHIEEGILKVRRGSALIKQLRSQLRTAQNEFNEIKHEIVEQRDL